MTDIITTITKLAERELGYFQAVANPPLTLAQISEAKQALMRAANAAYARGLEEVADQLWERGRFIHDAGVLGGSKELVAMGEEIETISECVRVGKDPNDEEHRRALAAKPVDSGDGQ